MSSQMFFDSNLSIIKTAFPETWRQIIVAGEMKTPDAYDFQVEETKSGVPTLRVEKDGKSLYLHSKYDPPREAQALIAQFTEVEKETTVVFYGTGLGYQINTFLQKYPTVSYYIYEPVPALLKAYLTHQSLKDLPGRNLQDIILGTYEQEIYRIFRHLIDKSQGKLLLVELPMHKQIFASEYEKFLELFQRTVKNKRTELHTNYAFQKRWIINSIKNFKEVLATPNIVMEAKGRFKNKPALLVAAGPSLNEEIENLRYIKENDLAYIFSVGSAINTLIHYRVYPHAACTYDPSERNQIVFEKLKREGIKEIPLVFGSSVGYETLENYPGQKYHMITSQDTVANYFLKTKEEDRLDLVSDAPTIAAVTLQLLHTLGFDPIVLVGQNLAYRGREKHAAGVDYSSGVTEQERENGLWVKDVYGREVLTNEGFNLMRKKLESYIKSFTDCKVINTTKDGAAIEGSVFLELDKVIDVYLREKVYEEYWLHKLTTNYDPEYLKHQMERMDRACQRVQRLTNEYEEILKIIERLIGNGNYREAEKMYVKLDKALGKIERNKFFTIFLLPMNRVQYKILADSIDSLNAESNPARKGQKVVERFKHFIDVCKRDLLVITPLYEELKGEILAYKG